MRPEYGVIRPTAASARRSGSTRPRPAISPIPAIATAALWMRSSGRKIARGRVAQVRSCTGRWSSAATISDGLQPAHSYGGKIKQTSGQTRPGIYTLAASGSRTIANGCWLARSGSCGFCQNLVRRSDPIGSISPFFCFELFQPTGDPSGAELAGITIPEHGHIPIPLQIAQMGATQIDGIEGLPQPHRRSRLSCIRGTLVKKTRRGDIARREQPIGTRQKPSDLRAGKGRPSRLVPRSG